MGADREGGVIRADSTPDVAFGDRFTGAFLGLMWLWAFSISVSIAVAEAAMWIAAVVWALGWMRRELDRGAGPDEAPRAGPAGDVFGMIGAPIIGFWGASLLSATLSRDPIESVWELREVFLFVAPLVTYQAFRSEHARRWAVRAFAAGVFVAVAWGLVQVVQASGRGDFPGPFRPTGPFGHYMTYAGVLMLSVPLLLAVRNGLQTVLLRLLAAVALGMVGLTMTRSAWLGCVASLAVYAACRWVPARAAPDPGTPGRNWAVYGVTIVVGGTIFAVLLLSFAGHHVLLDRGASIFSLDNPTNVDRLAMAAAGLRLIRANPVLGIGPGLTERVYPAWRVPWAVKENNPHLHNNLLQIGAERGLLGLTLWLWMMAAFVVGAWRVLRHGGAYGVGGPEAHAALAAMAGFMTMGMFEYNFSDSEVLMALLFVLSLPFAASAGMARGNAGQRRDEITRVN